MPVVIRSEKSATRYPPARISEIEKFSETDETVSRFLKIFDCLVLRGVPSTQAARTAQQLITGAPAREE